MTVSLTDVTIRYGTHVAVDGLSVVFPTGAVGLLGRNGAGKSSILKALLGLVRLERGRIRILDLPETASPAELRAQVGYMPERDAHLPQATGFEMVAMLGMLTGMPRRDAWRRSHEVLYLVGLEEQRYRPVAGYSAGMRQKAKLAAALVHDPKVLFLDEPTNGLDPDGRAEMLRLIDHLHRSLGKSIVLSTHILPDFEVVCDAAVVMERGRVVAQGSLAGLTGNRESEHQIVVEPSTASLESAPLPGIRLRNDGEGRHTVWIAEGVDQSALFAAVLAAGAVVRSFVRKRHSLEDVYLQAVQGTRDLPVVA